MTKRVAELLREYEDAFEHHRKRTELAEAKYEALIKMLADYEATKPLASIIVDATVANRWMADDRNRWKARAGALERELRLTSGCNSCIHSHALGVTAISFVGQKVCTECRNAKGEPINWEFDEARFDGKERNQQIPYNTFKNPVCKGDFALGTACGHCEKCEWIRQSIVSQG